jgi:hypothetical protein
VRRGIFYIKEKIMPLFEFTCFINVEADDYDSAIELFDSNVKYGLLNKNDIYVHEIEEK